MSKEYPEYIVGVDLSGDPRVGYAHYELMQDCKDAGLKITMHCGEVMSFFNEFTLFWRTNKVVINSSRYPMKTNASIF